MKTIEEIKAMRDELAEKYEAEHHKNFPDGMDLSPYSNSEIPATCYSAGFSAALELMLERERVAIDALQQVTGCPFTVDSATVPKIGISEAPPYQVVVVLSMAWTRLKQIRQTLEKLTKGENK